MINKYFYDSGFSRYFYYVIKSSAHIIYDFIQDSTDLINENQQQINCDIFQKRQNPRLACIALLKDQKIGSKSTVNAQTGARKQFNASIKSAEIIKKEFTHSANKVGRNSIAHPVIKERHFWNNIYCNKLKINYLFKNKDFSKNCDILRLTTYDS